MKKSVSAQGILVLIFFFISNFIHAQYFGWAHSFGSSEYESVYKTICDKNGNVYHIGYSNGTVDFDPGPGVYNLVNSSGSPMTYIQKLNPHGGLVWVKQIVGPSSIGYSIVVDTLLNVYATGEYTGTTDFDPDSGVVNMTAVGDYDIFICKLDSMGRLKWVKTAGSAAHDMARELALDATNNIYVTGYFRSTVDFDPGSGTANLTSSGNTDVFLMKYDSAGTFLWTRGFGTINGDEGISVAVDPLGNPTVTGLYFGTGDFNPESGVANLTSLGSNDNFLVRLNANGSFIWAKSFGGSSADNVSELEIDNLGNIYTVGYFSTTSDFDPGATSFNMTASGLYDIFVQKLDLNGNFIWAKKFGGSSMDFGHALALDLQGNIYVGGAFQGTADFDPGAGTANLVSGGSIGAFIQKLNNNGDYIWARSVGANNSVYTVSIAIDPYYNVYSVGLLQGTGDFDPGTQVYNLTSVSSTSPDIYILKLSECQSTSNTLTVASCGSYTLNNTTYTATGIYNQVLTNAGGCDSTITLQLTVHQGSSSSINTEACNSYTLNNVNYNQTGMYAQTLTNAAGCDSIITLDLTIKNSTANTIYENACGLYTLNGITYTTDGTYIQNLVNNDGCDSILTLNLSIFNINTTVYQTNNILSTDNNTGTYQWMDCNSSTAIQGETGDSYTATGNGSYAVIISENNCTDTSACVTITTTGLNEGSIENSFSFYPNPVKEELSIELTNQKESVQVRLYDSQGKMVMNQTINSSTNIKKQINVKGYAPGIYNLQVRSSNEVIHKKLIIN